MFGGGGSFETRFLAKLEKNFFKMLPTCLGLKTLLLFSFRQNFGVEINLLSNPRPFIVFHKSLAFPTLSVTLFLKYSIFLFFIVFLASF